MKYFLIIALSLLMTGGAAEAHNRNHNRNRNWHHAPGHVIYTPWGRISTVPQRIRISDHCVYKPWKNKTVCRY